MGTASSVRPTRPSARHEATSTTLPVTESDILPVATVHTAVVTESVPDAAVVHIAVPAIATVANPNNVVTTSTVEWVCTAVSGPYPPGQQTVIETAYQRHIGVLDNTCNRAHCDIRINGKHYIVLFKDDNSFAQMDVSTGQEQPVHRNETIRTTIGDASSITVRAPPPVHRNENTPTTIGGVSSITVPAPPQRWSAEEQDRMDTALLMSQTLAEQRMREDARIAQALRDSMLTAASASAAAASAPRASAGGSDDGGAATPHRTIPSSLWSEAATKVTKRSVERLFEMVRAKKDPNDILANAQSTHSDSHAIVQLVDAEQNSLMMIAAREHHTAFVAAFGSYVDMASTNAKGNTCLHLACCGSSAPACETIRQLLSLGAPVGTVNKFGDTPLHCAVDMGSSPVVSLLVEFGADINARNNAGQTPMDAASSSGLAALEEVMRATDGHRKKQSQVAGVRKVNVMNSGINQRCHIYIT